MIPFFSSTLLDKEGKPLKGRVHFYQADTNVHETVYRWLSFQQQWMEAANPNYTYIDGALGDNIFLENKLYSVRQEKYIGDYTDMSTDDRPEMWVADKSYYAGFDVASEAGGDSVAYGISALRNIVPEENMVVTVVGYNSADDCPARKYIWKPDSYATVDNGIVFNSEQVGTGRWILIPETGYIPSQYYGVYEGHETNIEALLSHPLQINNYSYPPAIKFATGHYTYALSLNTSYPVIVDDRSKFESAQFTCGTITVENTTSSRIDYIGNFVPSNDCIVKTSWFKNTNPMRFCSAATHFIVDGFFGTDDLTQDEFLVNEIIIGNPGDVSNHLKKMRTVNINGGNINADREIVASGYYLSNGLRMAQSGNGAYIMPLGNLTPAIKISKGAGFDAGEVDIPSLSSDNLSAASANITHLTGTYGYFSNTCTTNDFEGMEANIAEINTTAIGSQASAFVYFNHPWRTKAHDSTEAWVSQYNEGIYSISTAYTNWKFNPVHFNTNYACPIINVAYPVPKNWGFTFYNEAEPGTVASEAPSGNPVCLVLANGKNQDETWNFKKRVVYPGQHVYFHAVTTGSFKEELY